MSYPGCRQRLSAQTYALTRETEESRMRTAVFMILLAICGALLISARARAEEDPAAKAAKELENRLKNNRNTAALQAAVENAVGDDAKAAAKKALGDAKAKDQSKRTWPTTEQKKPWTISST